MKTRTMTTMSAISEWLSMESVSFTALCGEPVTHREVIITGAACTLFIPAVCALVYVASWLAGGAV